jgi:hypothetical protein
MHFSSQFLRVPGRINYNVSGNHLLILIQRQRWYSSRATTTAGFVEGQITNDERISTAADFPSRQFDSSFENFREAYKV